MLLLLVLLLSAWACPPPRLRRRRPVEVAGTSVEGGLINYSLDNA
ncbi:hypothetical protein [Pseudonocardia sp. WMMC193]|nr:hypothetical protein [Pseudonocardia sp. WMMC193]